MAQQDAEMFAPVRVRSLDQFGQNWVGLQSRAFEVLINHHHGVVVSFKFEQHVFRVKAEVDLVSQIDELWHNDLLILLMINANQRGVVAQIEKLRFELLFHAILYRNAFSGISRRKPESTSVSTPRAFWIKSMPREIRPFFVA